ncbi:hypothetical protein ACRN93_17325 [Shewanella baltica]|uniref:hypothetical protein n=1 Tax=Shewanella baltica TaxID=62322 RepID=UPI0039B0CCC3
MANWQLDMEVVRQGISKRGTAAFSLLVGCWVKPQDFDVDFDLKIQTKFGNGVCVSHQL